MQRWERMTNGSTRIDMFGGGVGKLVPWITLVRLHVRPREGGACLQGESDGSTEIFETRAGGPRADALD